MHLPETGAFSSPEQGDIPQSWERDPAKAEEMAYDQTIEQELRKKYIRQFGSVRQGREEEALTENDLDILERVPQLALVRAASQKYTASWFDLFNKWQDGRLDNETTRFEREQIAISQEELIDNAKLNQWADLSVKLILSDEIRRHESIVQNQLVQGKTIDQIIESQEELLSRQKKYYQRFLDESLEKESISSDLEELRQKKLDLQNMEHFLSIAKAIKEKE